MRHRQKRLAGWIARLCGKGPAPAARRATRRGLVFEDLEGRAVPSSFAFGFGGGPAFSQDRSVGHQAPPQQGAAATALNLTAGGVSLGSALGCNGAAGGAGSSSLLAQDARAVQQAFQTFDAAYLSAVAALRATATTTTPPTAAGIAAFDTAISNAINALDASISTDLANLANTGATLATTLDGYTSTLQTELESAGAGLANSTNAAVLAPRPGGVRRRRVGPEPGDGDDPRRDARRLDHAVDGPVHEPLRERLLPGVHAGGRQHRADGASPRARR